MRTPCPRYYEALQEVLESDELRRVAEDNSRLYAELSELTGRPVRNPDDIQDVYSTLRAESEYGVELPEWTKNYYPDKLLNLTELSYMYNVHTSEMKALKAGPFINKLISEFESKRDSTIKPKTLKISLYTGHDSSVVNILSGLNVWKQQFPTYGIMALFELVRDKATGELGVQLYLRNSATSGAIPLTIPGCDHFCPLDRFIEFGRQVVPKDHAAACIPRNKDFVPPKPGGP